MSRIARYPVLLPVNVKVSISSEKIFIQGPLGSLEQILNPKVGILQDGSTLKFSSVDNSRESVAMSGTFRALVNNMVTGVSKGFEKKLILIGVGYKVTIQDNILKLQLGFSHDIFHKLPSDIKAECPSQTEIVIKGINKQTVGEIASKIRSYRKPEPYKGKGIRYADEKVLIKETKKK